MNPMLIIIQALTLGENAAGTHIYGLPLSSPITLSGRSLNSIPFSISNVTVTSFRCYLSTFVPVNSNGKIVIKVNITSIDNYLPSGHLITRERDLYLNQINLPNLPKGETYTFVNGPDSEVSYQRFVTVISDGENTNSTIYDVEYVFDNIKTSLDVHIDFVESFSSFSNFEIQALLITNSNPNLPNVELSGTDLRGYIFVPRASQTTLSYNLVVHNNNVSKLFSSFSNK